MKIRFQADADLNQDLVSAVIRQEPAIDFQTANAAGLEGLDDPVVLAIAAGEGRILVSHDKKTMPHFFADFIAAESSPGVFIVPQRRSVAAAVVESLVLIWSASEAEEWVNQICRLPL